MPAKRGLWKTITLEDGSEQRVEFRGDEFANWWTTEDGRCFVAVDGTEVYHEVTQAELVEKATARRMEEAQKAQQAKEATGVVEPLSERRKIPGGTDKTLIGEKKGIIILVNFADTKFESEHDVDYYERFANEENFTDGEGNTRSVRDFFLEQSNGLLDLSFDVAGPVELEHEHTYYSHDHNDHYADMIKEACQGALEQGLDFSKYDWDGDGTVEQVFVMYAGHGAADTGDTSYTWPHKSYLLPSVDYGGTYVSVYACSCELAGNNRGDGIGALCHEYSHCFDLPDAYDSEGTGFYGMGTWSVLDYGSYNGDTYGYLPAGYTSYERACCGWLEPIELTEETEVTGMKGLTDGGEAYIVYNAGHTNEFYMLENRSSSGFDAELAGSGLLVVHVDYNNFYWGFNVVNSYAYGNTRERYTIMPADNVKSSRTESGDAWPNSGKTRLDDFTSPADEAYNFNSDGTQHMNLTLSRITKADDGTISFNFYPTGDTRESAPEGAVFYETFDWCEGEGGNDGDFSIDVATSEFYPDNEGWICSTSHGAMQCAMFGSNTQTANVLTPTFNITEETVLTFRAAPVTARVDGVIALSCESETSSISLSETEIVLPQGGWTYFTINLTGSGDVAIRMKETSGLNRFFLDSVTAIPLSEVSEGIVSVEANPTKTPEGIYTLQGVKVEKPTQKGVYIVNGKKYINK